MVPVTVAAGGTVVVIVATPPPTVEVWAVADCVLVDTVLVTSTVVTVVPCVSTVADVVGRMTVSVLVTGTGAGPAVTPMQEHALE